MADSKLRVQLIGDASRLNSSLNTASSRLKKFGNSVKSIGASMQRFSLPLALAGGAAIKMGVDFDKSMTKIKSLVGLAGDAVDKMGKQAREMAIETGISSTKAADALFFITSAGLKGDEAMSVLNASLKASAVGLGEVSVVADLATSAMNAYGSDVLSASGATDVLTAAVREGKLNSEDLATALGGVLPVASNMGVSFNEVGAAMAAMSRTGTNAAMGATQLTSILSGLLKPTKQAEDALNSMGLSSAGLKRQIKDEGLLSVLSTLKNEFDKNSDAAGRIFPNIKALKGVLDLTGAGAAQATEIFGKMENVLGDTQDAFDENAKSAGFKLTKSLNKAKESFSQMGAVLLNALLPFIQNLSDVVTTLFSGFNNLDTTMQTVIISVGLLIIALPTLLGLLGTLTTILGALLSPIGLVALALAGIAYIIVTNWSSIAPVLIDIYNRFVDLHNVSQGFRTFLYELEYQFKKTFYSMKEGVDQVINGIETLFKVAKNKFNPIAMQLAIADGFAKSKEISKKAGEDIGLALAESIGKKLNKTLKNKTVDQLNSSLKQMGSGVKDYWNSIMSAIGIGGGGGGGGESGDTGGGEGGKSNIEVAAESAGKAADTTKQKFLQLMLTSNMMGEQISGAFMMAFEAMAEGENFFKSLIQGLVGLIKKLIAAALAAFVLSTLLGGMGIGGIEKGSAGFKKLFGSLSGLGGATKMANGGIVSSPTLGLMGEYPGARSNPEVIAPLDKLKGLIGNSGSNNVQVGGQFVLKGQDLIVSLERATNNRNRIL
tara:strand:+ start:670 stop:2991 length:2322 start_codon:yes stop_codon:yes gene_type:complete